MRRRAKVAAWVIVAFAAMTSNASAEDTSCQLVQLSKLDMTVDTTGRVSVPISINGQTAHLIVDTGASTSMLNLSTASLPGMRIFGSGLLSVEIYGGYKSNAFVVVQNSAFGDMKPGYHQFFVAPDAAFPSGVSGFIGADVLRHFDIELDFANNALGIFSQSHCPGTVVYWTRDAYARVGFTFDKWGHIRIPVQLDGGLTLATVDTGATWTVGSLEDITAGLHIDPKDPALSAASDAKDQLHPYHYPFKTLTFEGVTVNNPDILLVPNDVSKAPPDQRQLIIGMNVLRRLHIFIDYGEQALYITPATAH